jgi:hypothetical protein
VIHQHHGNPRMKPGYFEFRCTAARELDDNPQLWNEHPWRTQGNSPHRGVDDIWLRYNALEKLGPHFNDEHESVWYPCAEKLPICQWLVCRLARNLGAETIGGVLITRIPPGGQVYWHSDSGWHARSHRKFVVLLRGNSEQRFEFENETLGCYPGEWFEFENQYPHRVLNPSDEERISLIVCLRDFQ